jgi:cytochrome c-type biogenesis protein CcmH
MTLWIIFAALTLGALALLLVPLLRRPAAVPARVDYDIVVYRDQLTEVDKDLERGMLTADQAAAARTEIHRRMLAAEDAELSGPAPDKLLLASSRRLRLITAVVIGVAVPAGALALYLDLGSPSLPGQPFAERQQSDPDFKMIALAERLAADLRAKPDADGYATLAETYTALHRYPEAVEAYRQAISMGMVDAEMISSMAEAIVMTNDGSVVPEARQAFQQALTLDKNEPRARFYLGLAEAQMGQYAAAVSIWRDLEQGSPEGAPWLPMLKEHIEQYAKQGGFDPTSIKPVPPAPAGTATAKGPNPHAAPGTSTAGGPPAAAGASGMPSGDAAAAVMAQSPEERQQTIRAMVAGLAARLQNAPDDFEGWVRLSRSYRVLGDLDKARDAANHAVKLKPKAVEPKLALADIQLASAKDGGKLPGDFVATMREVLALDANNAEAMYYVGAAEAEAGRLGRARELWSKLLAAMPADAPERQKVAKQLEALPKN